MRDIRFTCPDCEGHLVVDAAGAGRQISCPHCGKHLVIPEPEPPPPLAAPTQVEIAPPAGVSGALHLKQVSSPDEMGYEDDQPHGSDVNVTQPVSKKKDQWFTENGKKYHYCYYDPHSPIMKTACGKGEMPVSADIAPSDLDTLKKGALCEDCLAALNP